MFGILFDEFYSSYSLYYSQVFFISFSFSIEFLISGLFVVMLRIVCVGISYHEIEYYHPNLLLHSIRSSSSTSSSDDTIFLAALSTGTRKQSFSGPFYAFRNINYQFVVVLSSGITYSFHTHTPTACSIVLQCLFDYGLFIASNDILLYSNFRNLHSPLSFSYLLKHLDSSATFDLYNEQSIIDYLNMAYTFRLIHRLKCTSSGL